MSEPKRIISWSGGKDSTATVILAHEHGIPIDEIVMACLWFDKARNISAITPPHWEFITKVAIPKFQEWGYKVTLVDGKRDYLDEFNCIINQSKKQERNGKKRGFLIQGLCKMTAVKQETIGRIKKQYAGCIDYQGIAIDEPVRLERLHERKNNISLLEQYNYTEEQAKELCRKYGLLSPLYNMGDIARDGCWFCPNARLAEWAHIKINYPQLWGELKELSKDDNLASPYFSRGITFDELDRKVDRYIHRPIQCSFWELLENKNNGKD